MESSTTSSRTHFEVLGLGLEGKVIGLGLQAYKSSKMPCLRSRTALFFDLQKVGQSHYLFFSSFWRTRQRPRGKFMKTFLFWKTLALCVVGPWPRAFLSLASRGSVLGLGLFCVLVLGLEPGVFDSTSAVISLTFT